MTLEEYIEKLNKFVEENPECLKMDIITSRDDEGNGFNPVHWGPSKFVEENDQYESYDELDHDSEDINTVCLN